MIEDRPLDDLKLLELFTKLHGIPRRCFRALSHNGEAFEMDAIQTALNEIKDFESFAYAASGHLPFTRSASHALVRIEPTNDIWGNPATALLSQYVAELVLDRVELYNAVTIWSMINTLLPHSNARGWAGSLFESAVHRKFRAGISFSPQGLDGDCPPLSIDIKATDHETDGYFYTLSIRKEARSRKVHGDFLRQYLIPLSSTAKAIDSVYISDSVTVLFQITVSPDHDLLLHGITELIDELPANAKKRICIVFVVPDHNTTLKPYRRQRIVQPAGTQGTKTDVVRTVENYKQYVHYVALS